MYCPVGQYVQLDAFGAYIFEGHAATQTLFYSSCSWRGGFKVPAHELTQLLPKVPECK